MPVTYATSILTALPQAVIQPRAPGRPFGPDVLTLSDETKGFRRPRSLSISKFMGSRLRRSETEAAFTLIELLVVIIIIGILAAIAIPVFLNQRQKGYDASAKSDLRNLANFEEIYLHDFSVYGTIASIQATEPTVSLSKNVTLRVVHYNGANGYCLSSVHSTSGVTWYYDSLGGGLQPKGSSDCSVTTTGTLGDSATG